MAKKKVAAKGRKTAGAENTANGKKPAISVIMGVYNQRDRDVLNYAVKSILDQDFDDFEFIIYDDGSDPEAAAYIRELGSLDPRIVLIGKEENHGLAFSLNACIDRANGRYIARMDADDYSRPDRLRAQYTYMEAHPEIAWCGCNVRLFDESGVWGSRQYPEYPKSEDYLRFSPFAHPTVMYRSEILKNNRYLDSRETLRCEDYEIFMRFQRKGLQGCNLQQELFDYRENKDSFKRRKLRYRVNETRVRFRNFQKMGILFPRGWVYALRPLAGAVMPNSLIQLMKRRESGDEGKPSRKIENDRG